jgi:hypothetical protein
MPVVAENEIREMLSGLFVFDDEFKAKILDKIKAGLNTARLEKLKKILAEAVKWQIGVVARKLAQDKTFLRRFAAQKNKIDQEILDERVKTLKDNDFKKMQTILLKIKNI